MDPAHAIDTVARHFSATPQKGEVLTVRGKRVQIEVRNFDSGASRHAVLARAGLRFDRVALELVRRVQAALCDAVPKERKLLFTVSAPIRQATKTAAELALAMQPWLAHGRSAELKITINENAIRVRLVKETGRQAPNVIGFVHNPDSDAGALLDIAQAFLACFGSLSSSRRNIAQAKWLVLVDESGPASIAVYRQIFSALPRPIGFEKIFLVRPGAPLEDISD